jgi:hypothetical protein
MKSQQRHFPFLILGLLATAASANAQPDFRPTTIRDVAVSGSSGQKVLAFTVGIENAGNQAYRGLLKIRPILIPTSAKVSGFVNDRGVMVTARSSAVDLAPQSSSQVTFRGALPLVPERDYVLGVIVNSDRAIDEGSEAALANNLLADLTPVRTVVNSGTNSETARSDYWSDTTDNEFLRGGASHYWRLFKRGNPNGDGLRSLFLIADTEKLKIYDSDYEKSVHWADSGAAYDSRGRAVHYDIYSQAPSYEAVPSGNLALLTLIDHTDSTNEPVRSNNLDVRRFKASHLSLSTENTWCASAGDPASRTVTLSTQYGAAANWNISSPLPSWLTLNQTSGTLSGDAPETALTLTCNPAGLATGDHHEHVELTSAGFPGESKTLHLHFFVQATGAALQAPAELTVSAVQGRAVPTQTLTLHNPGPTPRQYRVETAQPWIAFQSGYTGVIAPGASAQVVFAIENQTLGAEAEGAITVQSDLPGPDQSVTLHYRGTVPTARGE